MNFEAGNVSQQGGTLHKTNISPPNRKMKIIRLGGSGTVSICIKMAQGSAAEASGASGSMQASGPSLNTVYHLKFNDAAANDSKWRPYPGSFLEIRKFSIGLSFA